MNIKCALLTAIALLAVPFVLLSAENKTVTAEWVEPLEKIASSDSRFVPYYEDAPNTEQ